MFCQDTTGVDRVMIGGRIVVESGTALGVDMRKLAAAAANAAAHLAEVNAGARALVQALEPVVLDYRVGLARQPYHVQRWCGDPGRAGPV